MERTLARIDVWERGWIHSWAAKSTYENAAGVRLSWRRRTDRIGGSSVDELHAPLPVAHITGKRHKYSPIPFRADDAEARHNFFAREHDGNRATQSSITFSFIRITVVAAC